MYSDSLANCTFIDQAVDFVHEDEMAQKLHRNCCLCGERCKQPGNKAIILHATYDFTNLVSPQFPSLHHSQELPIAQLTITCRTDHAHTVVPV